LGKAIRGRLPPDCLERWDTPDNDFVEVYRLERLEAHLASCCSMASRGRFARITRKAAQPKRPGVVGVRISSFSGRAFRAESHSPFYLPANDRRRIRSGPDFATASDITTRHRGVSLGGMCFSNCWASEAQTFRRIEGCWRRFRSPLSFPLFPTNQRGFSRFYQKFFLGSLRRKAQEKAERFRDLAPADRI